MTYYIKGDTPRPCIVCGKKLQKNQLKCCSRQCLAEHTNKNNKITSQQRNVLEAIVANGGVRWIPTTISVTSLIAGRVRPLVEVLDERPLGIGTHTESLMRLSLAGRRWAIHEGLLDEEEAV